MNQINPQEEIAYIKNIINDSKRIIIDDGKGFVLWGILVIIGLLLTFFAIYFQYFDYLWLVWPFLMAFGWLYSLVIQFKKEKKRKVSTFAGKILGAVWLSSGISISMIALVGIYTDAFDSSYISPITSTILGVSYFVSGALYGKKWISMLSFGWWAAALFTFLFVSVYNLLIFAGVMLFLQTIPGIILYQNSKKSL